MRGMIQHWEDYLFPPRCVLCGDTGAHSRSGLRDLCDGCRNDLPRLGPSCATCARPTPTPVAACGKCMQQRPLFDYMNCVFEYAAPLDWIIARFKFQRQMACGRLLSQLLVEDWAGDGAGGETPDVIVPVPLHRSRLRQRGFNQALELFRPLAKAQGIAVSAGLCVRVRPTPAQAGLDGKARRRNVRGAFEIKGDCAGLHVVIIDDVVTTGSTVSEMARVLKRAGAARVGVWALARTVTHHTVP